MKLIKNDYSRAIVFFVRLKLELLTQFPASNERKIVLFIKNRHVPNLNYLIN